MRKNIDITGGEVARNRHKISLEAFQLSSRISGEGIFSVLKDCWWLAQIAGFRLADGFISFVSPKEMNKRKGDPAIAEFPEKNASARSSPTHH